MLTGAATVAGDLLHSFHQRLPTILTQLLDGAADLEPGPLPAAGLALLLEATTRDPSPTKPGRPRVTTGPGSTLS
ncbi:hypothetical protein ABGB07_24635 [Micromonosporaceae bacterium B7E4]